MSSKYLVFKAFDRVKKTQQSEQTELTWTAYFSLNLLQYEFTDIDLIT